MFTRLCLIFLLHLVVIDSSQGQEQPYHYDIQVNYVLTYQFDSTNKSSIRSDFFNLFIGNDQSVFCSSTYLMVDSAWKSNLTMGNQFGPSFDFFSSISFENNRFVIFKNSEYIFTYDQCARYIPEIYAYTEQKSQLEWKILSDTTSIGNILCQKAETQLGNRNWIAWFATSIPISDGPYKFSGLPGLILKISDEQQYWNFDLAGISKIDKAINVLFFNRVPIKIKNKNAFLAQKQFARDNRLEIMESKGTQITNKGYLKKTYLKQAGKDNNWIELYKEK